MKNTQIIILGLVVLGLFNSTNAKEGVIPNENKIEFIEKLEKKTIDEKLNKKQLKDNLPSEELSKEEQIKQGLAYFSKHPEELEQLFLQLIRQKDIEKIKLLLPVYKEYPKKDMSLVDWSNALIYEENNDYHQAVNIYRKMNSALPHLKTLRFHMANALFRDKQYTAAKSEFEKLRSENIALEDKEIINDYLDAIREADTWSFYVNASFVNDKNLNNSAPKGTKVVSPEGRILTVKNDPESAKGISYNLGLGKKFQLKNNYFTSLNGDISGTYYWNNHKYNDLSVEVATGVGYGDARKEIEISPFFRNRLYADVKENGSLSQYAKVFGVRLTGAYWLSNKWRYNGALIFGRNKYVEDYDHMNGNTVSISNSLAYMPSHTRYFYAGINLSAKDTLYDRDSTKTMGVRAGWVESWNKGFSTRLGLGFSKDFYQGKDLFVGIKRKDTNINVNTSVWNRNLHLFGITPKLSYQYNKTSSNNALKEYDKHNVFLEFSKDF